MHEQRNAPGPPRYPEVTVELIGRDGNVFTVLGHTLAALRDAGVPQDERDEFLAEATAGDYDDLLRAVMRWVEVA